jgi:hypothetical protein
MVELEAVLVAAEGSTDRARQHATAEHSVVALQDAYGRFIRELILRSVMGNATDATGRRLRPGPLGVVRTQGALDELRQKWPAYRATPRRGKRKPIPPVRKPLHRNWEPDWHVDYCWTQALTILQPVNANAIAAGLGAGSAAALELRRVRNFSVHRGETSADGIAEVAAGHGLTAWRQPRDIVVASIGGGRAGLFSSWCARLTAVSRAAVR